MCPSRLPLHLFLVVVLRLLPFSRSSCPNSPCTAVASYLVLMGDNLSFIGSIFGIGDRAGLQSQIPPYNPNLTSIDSIAAGVPINVPFECRCLGNDDTFLAGEFQYNVGQGQTYSYMAQTVYRNLTTADWLTRRNSYEVTNIPFPGTVNVTINCSCGDPSISSEYGLFATYPLRPEQTEQSVAAEFGFGSVDLLRRYNPGVNFGAGSGIVFVPIRDANGSYHPLLLPSKQGISGGLIAGICVAAGVVLLVFVSLPFICRRRKIRAHTLLGEADVKLDTQLGETSSMHTITIEQAVEFSYEELAKATDDFSLANKIGEGGFGSVYLAELRGEKTAVKRMPLESSKEFAAEVNVLSRVHHLNLVRLIGYCVENSLFLVYEYMEEGNLSQHLRSLAKEPLSWATRVQVALDSARGLEYIHEHTAQAYIHRDIKSANILLDKNLHAKVADFGLAKFSQAKSHSKESAQTKHVVGTFGYMAPEYATYGDISPKLDVYAFGVVLYELISAKEAVLKTTTGVAESKGLVSMFEGIFNHPNPQEEMRNFIDPRLGDNFPIDAVYKMAELGKVCTQEDPQLRPSMRNIVVALMMLSSRTEGWDIGQFYDNHQISHAMSGR